MSASTQAAEAPQKEYETHDEHGDGQPPEALTRPSVAELEVARALVRSAHEGDRLDQRLESLNARYRRAVSVRGQFPTGPAAVKRLYLMGSQNTRYGSTR
jgi:hypothetical protein